MRRLPFFIIACLSIAWSAGAGDLPKARPWTAIPDAKAVRLSCKSVGSCAEAVALWCGGYSRADGDGDGVPCENVCSNRAEVEAIEAEIGCSN